MEIDVSKSIEPKSDQLNADDLISGAKVIKITRVSALQNMSEQQPVSVHYENEAGRPYKPCKTCRRILVALYGNDAAKWVGHSLELYRDDSVTFGGQKVGGIRITKASGISAPVTILATLTRGKRVPVVIEPLEVEAPQDDATSDWRATFATLQTLAEFNEFLGKIKSESKEVKAMFMNAAKLAGYEWSNELKQFIEGQSND